MRAHQEQSRQIRGEHYKRALKNNAVTDALRARSASGAPLTSPASPRSFTVVRLAMSGRKTAFGETGAVAAFGQKGWSAGKDFLRLKRTDRRAYLS